MNIRIYQVLNYSFNKEFWDTKQISKKGYYRSKTGKTDINHWILHIRIFTSNWQFWSSGPNLLKKAKQKALTSFCHVTSANVGSRPPKTFWLLVSTPLPHFCKISRPYLVPWTMSTPQKKKKKRFLWSNPYKIKVMITSLIVVLDLPNFGHMSTFTKWFESRHKILLVAPLAEILTFISKCLYFKKT